MEKISIKKKAVKKAEGLESRISEEEVRPIDRLPQVTEEDPEDDPTPPTATANILECTEESMRGEGAVNITALPPKSQKLSYNEIKSMIKPLQSVNTSKGRSSQGVVSVIFHEKCGARLAISKQVTDITGSEEKIFLGLAGDMILFSGKLAPGLQEFDLKKQGNKFIIYNKHLVLEVAKSLSLEYLNSRTSHTLSKMEIIEEGEEKLITVRK